MVACEAKELRRFRRGNQKGRHLRFLPSWRLPFPLGMARQRLVRTETIRTRQRIFSTAGRALHVHVCAYSQCRIDYCYTCGSIYAGCGRVSDTAYRQGHGSALCSPTEEKNPLPFPFSGAVSSLRFSPCPLRESGRFTRRRKPQVVSFLCPRRVGESGSLRKRPRRVQRHNPDFIQFKYRIHPR